MDPMLELRRSAWSLGWEQAGKGRTPARGGGANHAQMPSDECEYCGSREPVSEVMEPLVNMPLCVQAVVSLRG